jgi:hypothetical protein
MDISRSSLILIVIASIARGATIESDPPVSLSLDNASFQTLGAELIKQGAVLHVGLPKELERIPGITLDVQNVPLSVVVRMLKEQYNLCAWRTVSKALSAPNPGDLNFELCSSPPPFPAKYSYLFAPYP